MGSLDGGGGWCRLQYLECEMEEALTDTIRASVCLSLTMSVLVFAEFENFHKTS